MTTPEYIKRASRNYRNSKYQIVTLLPAEYRDIIKSNISGSVNAYINNLVTEDLKKRGLLPAASSQDAAPARAEDEHGPDWLPFS